MRMEQHLNNSDQDMHVMRQPIFDRQLKVHAYKLIPRFGFDIFNDHADIYSQYINKTMSLLKNWNELINGKKALLHFSEDLVVNEMISPLPNESLLIEFSNNNCANDEMITACENLKNSGYHLVLEDVSYNDNIDPLINFVEIVKVNFKKIDAEKRKILLKKYKSQNIKFLAFNIYCFDEYKEAFSSGYSYFHGDFFFKPTYHSFSDLWMSKLHYLKLLHKINQPNIEFNEIEKIISEDVSLTYKLLRFINSSFYNFSNEIKSIIQALVLLGINEIKKWASLLVFNGVKGNKPDELIVNSLLRAKLCQDFATIIGMENRKSEFYLMGLFSHIDAFFNRPIAEILDKLPLSKDVKFALLGNKNSFRIVLDIIQAYEKGDWGAFSAIMESYDLNESSFFNLYLNSLKWINLIHPDVFNINDGNKYNKSMLISDKEEPKLCGSRYAVSVE